MRHKPIRPASSAKSGKQPTGIRGDPPIGTTKSGSKVETKDHSWWTGLCTLLWMDQARACARLTYIPFDHCSPPTSRIAARLDYIPNPLNSLPPPIIRSPPPHSHLSSISPPCPAPPYYVRPSNQSAWLCDISRQILGATPGSSNLSCSAQISINPCI